MADAQPTLETPRLVLRPLQPGDAEAIQLLASAREVAASTAMIPHPYPEGAAAEFITLVTEGFARGSTVVFAITLREGDAFAGCCGLHLEPDHDRAELGYWIGIPYWGRGIATEAALAVIEYGFRERGLRRIFASCFRRNPASARVLEKVGFMREGLSREHFRKWDVHEDLLQYGLLRREWEMALPHR